MLNVQVEYLKLLETQKHNRAQEDIGYQTINETVRHNKVAENQNQQSINEAIQHNRATEAIGYMQANAALRQADTARMLANAQIPLIQAQTKTEGYKASLTKNQAIKVGYEAQSAKTMARYNEFAYGIGEDTMTDFTGLGEAMAIGKFINEIIPF